MKFIIHLSEKTVLKIKRAAAEHYGKRVSSITVEEFNEFVHFKFGQMITELDQNYKLSKQS